MRTRKPVIKGRSVATEAADAEQHDDDFDVIVKPSTKAGAENESPKLASQHNYYTEKDISKILANLDSLRNNVYPPEELEGDAEPNLQNFPSVCLIGLGRCGSNIALEVASLVHNARNFYLNALNVEQKKIKESDSKPTRWLQRNLKLNQKNVTKPVFLIEPLVMLGDLDKDIHGRIRYSTKSNNNDFLDEYTKIKNPRSKLRGIAGITIVASVLH